MPDFFRTRTFDCSKLLHVRDLRPGMVVPVGDGKTATIHSIEWMNGRNGEPPMMVKGGKSAIAMKIYFHERGPIIAHPNQVVR